MANMPMNGAEIQAPEDSRSAIERAIDDQAAVIEDLEISLNMLAKYADFLMIPMAPVALQESIGQSPQQIAPAMSRAVETVRAHTRILRRLSDEIDELKNRLTK